MQWHEVLEVLDALERAGVCHWLAGGWGVDALVGAETRRHRDLDLMVDAEDHEACMATLAGLGYTVETDWLPVRVEVVAGADRWVDVHPVRFDAQGNGLQGDPDGTHFRYPSTAFVVGRLGDRHVPCMSAAEQVRARTGYELRPQDEHDLRQLAILHATAQRRNVTP